MTVPGSGSAKGLDRRVEAARRGAKCACAERAILFSLVAWLASCAGRSSSAPLAEASSGGGAGDGDTAGAGTGAAAGVGTGVAPGPSASPGGPSGSPATPLGPPAPPLELTAIDHGYPLARPVNFMCPEGTAPSERFFCTDVPFCNCEYVCMPSCAAGQVCAPAADAAGAAQCRCHAALEASAEGCVWRGLVADPSFDDASSWNVWTRSEADSALAEISGSRLELRVSRRCSYAWAGTAARLPAREQFASGAALVFDYRATSDALDADTTLFFRVDGLADGPALDLSGRPAQMRRCVSLMDRDPWLKLLEFGLEVFGACQEAVDVELSVDDVRLEAEPSCG